MAAKRPLNFNVGLMGHVDSGKTSLARALSTELSTCALDKHPQSLERGITLDLGFSAFRLPLPAHLDGAVAALHTELQVTLVDCPGHASLIRTIIGGASIIDLMLLVVDATKGMQTQTAECLVVGEIVAPQMLMVLNKTDLLPAAERDASLARLRRRLAATLAATKFAGAASVAVAAAPGVPPVAEGAPGGAGAHPEIEGSADSFAESHAPRAAEGMRELVAAIAAAVLPSGPSRQPGGPFLFAADHCFAIKGQGTVVTGTVLRGTVAVNDAVEFPDLRLVKKVKGLQSFRRPVASATAGDRAAICVAGLDPSTLERGLVCAPGTVPLLHGAVATADRVRYYKGRIATGAMFHVSVGHATVTAEVLFFAPEGPSREFETSREFEWSRDYARREELLPAIDAAGVPQLVLLRFSTALACPSGAMVLASKLDGDPSLPGCRLAFSGRLLAPIDPRDGGAMSRLRIYTTKTREGVLERYEDGGRTAIGRGLFKRETDMAAFVGLRLTTDAGEQGTIQAPFGKSGKFRAVFPGGVRDPSVSEPAVAEGDEGESEGEPADAGAGPKLKRVTLSFRRFVFDRDKKMVQG